MLSTNVPEIIINAVNKITCNIILLILKEHYYHYHQYHNMIRYEVMLSSLYLLLEGDFEVVRGFSKYLVFGGNTL